ncbi:MAG: GDYXXLXY domain-containing protein [Rickettsiales bacterium]|jgi:hypothetical protein|nr:GDYXXLXY domain-containing protein [Rickettsiales bacterium]
MKKLLYVPLFAPVVFFVGWVGSLEYKKAHAQKVIVAAVGYDPSDLFRGHYLWLHVDWDATDCAQFPDKSCPKDEFNSRYSFYLNQRKAEGLDAPVRNAGRGKIAKVEMVFRYMPESVPLLDGLLLDGIPYSEWYEKNAGK